MNIKSILSIGHWNADFQDGEQAADGRHREVFYFGEGNPVPPEFAQLQPGNHVRFQSDIDQGINAVYEIEDLPADRGVFESFDATATFLACGPHTDHHFPPTGNDAETTRKANEVRAWAYRDRTK